MAFLYVELWTENDKWLQLSEQQRQDRLAQIKIGSLDQEGVNFLGFAANQVRTGPHSVKHRWIAVWTIPSLELVQRFEKRVTDLGWWFDFFDQENAYGELSDDKMAAVGSMIGVGSASGAGTGLMSMLREMRAQLKTLSKEVADIRQAKQGE